MQQYAHKEEFIDTLRKSADLFIVEFEGISESDKNCRLEEGERTPYENLAYQLGWMKLLQTWEAAESAGKNPEMPAPGIKWNKLGELHQRFYATYQNSSLEELISTFRATVDDLCVWLADFDDDTLFLPGGRIWARSTNSNWPVWKWVHINTVAPFKSFRTKLRKWKKLKLTGKP